MVTSNDVTIWSGIHVVPYSELCSAPAYVSLQAYREVEQENIRLRAALERYGRHEHPNCHDLTLKEDGSFGPRNGCLCGFDAAKGESSAHETSTSRDARRYAVISRCIAPRDLYDKLVYDGKSPGKWVDLPREQSIQQKIDELCDAALQRSSVEPKVTLSPLEWEVTYDVVAYNSSWNGYGENASKDGFRSPGEAIAYAKPLGAHLDAQVWQRTKPKSVATVASIKIWPAEKAGCALCAEGMNSFADPATGNRMHARNGVVTVCTARNGEAPQ